MLEVLETILFPIVWLMQWVLEFYSSLFSSTGISIILLSFTFALLLLPLRKLAAGLEDRVNIRMATASAEVELLKCTLKGEALFLETEKIYKSI